MSEHPIAEASAVNPQKARKGLNRILHATGYSLQGLRAGWGETAFRQEAILAIPLVPLAFVIGTNWLETAMLIAVVVLVMRWRLYSDGGCGQQKTLIVFK